MPIEINDALIKQWEPKIHKLLQNTYVIGMDHDDLQQELRIAIVKAARGFNEDKGVLIHTYLHTAMVNTLRTLISKAQRQVMTESLDEYTEAETIPTKVLDVLQKEDNKEDFEIRDMLAQYDLTTEETRFIFLRVQGLTMEEISTELNDSAYRIRQSVQYKIGGSDALHKAWSQGIANRYSKTLDNRVRPL